MLMFALKGLMMMRILSSGPVCFITGRQTALIWTGSIQTEKTTRFIVYFATEGGGGEGVYEEQSMVIMYK